MRNTKLINIIEKFSRTDLRQLAKFIDSSFFGASQTERALFDFIYKNVPAFEAKRITKERAFAHIFKNKKYDERVIVRLQSRLLKKVELFIFYHFKEEDSPDVELALMKFYDQKNLTTYFRNTYRNVKGSQENYPYRDSEYYYKQLLIEKQYRFFLMGNHEDSRGGAHHREVMQQLDIYYLTDKLIQLCQMFNRQLVTNIDYDILLMDEILTFLPGSEYSKKNPVIELWHEALLLLKSSEKSVHYHNLKQLLTKHESLQKPMYQRMLYTYLENTSRAVFKEDEVYYDAMFELYQTQLESGVIYIKGYLLPTVFKNITTVALRLGRLDWTTEFLEHNQYKIAPEYEGREDIHTYCLAQLYFKQNKFDAALEALNKMAFNDVYTSMDVRRMLMKVYYEMEYVGMFEDMINSFRVFLTQNQSTIPGVHVKAHRDFINVIRRIYSTVTKDVNTLDSIKASIEETNVLPEKTWLLEKLLALH